MVRGRLTSTKVTLEARVREQLHIIMEIVVRATVVRVERLLRLVGGKHEIIVHVAENRNHAALAAEVVNVRNAIPRIEWAVVAALAARVRKKIVRNDVASAKAVIEVDMRTRAVEDDISGNLRERTDRLKVEGGLLLIDANLMSQIVRDHRSAWLLA